MQQVGGRLIGLRAVYGLSQRELAKRAGVPNSAISVIEQGKSSPSLVSLEKVLRGFPLSVQQFFSLVLPGDPHFSLADTVMADFLQIQLCDSSDSGKVKITSGPSKILPISGSLKVFNCFYVALLAAGEPYFMPAHSPFRVEIDKQETTWVEVEIRSDP